MVSAADVLVQVSIDHEFVDKALLAFINTISDERDEVRVAYLAKQHHLVP